MAVVRRWGWRPDTPDLRDHRFLRPARGAPLLEEVDLRAQCSPVEDQGELGSCTAHAICGAMEFLSLAVHGKHRKFSRLFIYYNERATEGTVANDAGAELRDGIKSVAKIGAPLERYWPYNISKFTHRPPPPAYHNAEAHKVVSYKRLSGAVDDMRSALCSGTPVAFGISVYESFMADEAAHSGIITMPTSSERLLGGHAMLAVGYHDKAKVLIVRNSWGAYWGDQGYCYLPYAYIASRDLSDDFWVITAEMR